MRFKLTHPVVLFLVLRLAAQQPPPQDQKGLSILDAVESAIRNHPGLKAQVAQVEISRALYEQAGGSFDVITQGNLNQQRIDTPLSTAQQIENQTFGINSSIERANQTQVLAGASKLFRSGITLATNFQVARTEDNLLSSTGINTSSTALSLTFPLFRGRGHKAAAAQEDAADTEVKATEFDLNQLTARLMANAAISYWNYVASRKLLNIAEQAEDRGQSYLRTVQSLIDADHVPRNDLNEVKANLAQRSSARVNSEQQVVSAEQQLSLDMGLAPAEMLGRAADPTDDLPTPDDDQPMPENDPASLSDYLDQALAQRADYLAAKQRLREADIVDVAAKNRLLPQVDFVVGSSYAAVRDGSAISDFFSAPGTGLAGPSATATVNYTFLGGNHSARGALRQADASRRQAALQLEQVSRNITADLVTSVAAVRNGIIRSRSAKLAVESFDAALAGAREKYRLGLGSVIDILTLEDKLNSAQTDEIQARLAYAIALTQFRLATGTLLPGGRTRQVLDSSMFVTPPFTGRTRRP